MNAERGQQERFLRTFGSVVAGVCAERRVPPEVARECLAQAAAYSGFGRFAFANNFWMLPGTGDRGFYTVTRVYRSPESGFNGGVRVEVLRLARFSTPAAGVVAWLSRGPA